MPGPANQIKEAWVVLPVLLLLLVGGAIALQSGVRRTAYGCDLRQFAANLSRMLLRVLGYVAVLLALQSLIGFRLSLGW